MSKRKVHFPQIESFLQEFADEYGIRYECYSQYHMRLMNDFTCIDVWTTGKYYILETNYYKMMHGIIERGNEKGMLATKNKPAQSFLHKLFFPTDYL